MKNNCCIFDRLFKIQKNGIFLLGIILSVRDRHLCIIQIGKWWRHKVCNYNGKKRHSNTRQLFFMSYRSGTLSIQPEKERKVKCNRNFPQEISKKLKFQKMLSQLSLIISENLNWNFWLNGKNLGFSNLSVLHNRHAQCLQLPERTSLLEFQTMVLIFFAHSAN